MLTLQLHRAIEARAAVVALKKIVIPIFPVLVLLAATYSVPVHSARRNLHLVHFWGGKEMGSEPLSVTHAHTHAVYHICTCISAPHATQICTPSQRDRCTRFSQCPP